MSYQYRTKPPAKDGSFGFSFPCLEAELSEDVVKASGIAPALKRIGKQLMKQYGSQKTKEGGKAVIGIEFHNVGFTFILDSKKKPE